jgi:hypothetical protein
MFAKVTMAVSVALAFIAPSPSAAQNTDLDKITCDQFLGSNAASVKEMMLWLAGYYTYADDPTVIDMGRIQDQERRLKALCSENKAMSVLAASETIMDKMFKK